MWTPTEKTLHLSILREVLYGPQSVRELAARLGLPVDQVDRAVGLLVAQGVLTVEEDRYRLDRDVNTSQLKGATGT